MATSKAIFKVDLGDLLVLSFSHLYQAEFLKISQILEYAFEVTVHELRQLIDR